MLDWDRRGDRAMHLGRGRATGVLRRQVGVVAQLESASGIVEGRPGCSGLAPSLSSPGTEVRSACFTGAGTRGPFISDFCFPPDLKLVVRLREIQGARMGHDGAEHSRLLHYLCGAASRS